MDDTIKILVVDGDGGDREPLQTLLDSAGAGHFAVQWSSRTDNLLIVARNGTCDVIVWRWQAPYAAGLDLLRGARSHGVNAPLLVLTDTLVPAVDRDAVRAGAADYLILDQLDAGILERSLRYAMARKAVERRLARLAHYDSLTDIPNRTLFRDRLDHAIRIAERDKLSFALMYVDLNGFKRINDSFGHDVGDALIQLCAKRLCSCLRRSDSVARVGGDEFVLLLENTDSSVGIAHIAEKVIKSLTRPHQVGSHSILVGCSIGIAVYPEAGTDADTLQKNADLAMYQAKLEESSTFHFFTEAMGREVRQQLLLESQLRRAVRRQEFRLLYQPRIDIKTGRVQGFEALIRWRHPERGLLLPEEFIGVAEDTGLIEPIGYWVIRQACTDLRRLELLGFPPLTMSINLSVRQFNDERLVERIALLFRELGVNPHHIEFELTETAIMENIELVELCMRPLAHLGCRFALDDFGTGYSSFLQLQRLPISTIKVDKQFIDDMTTKKQDASLVQAMIQLAHSLGKTVIAEGVEASAQSILLDQFGCDESQGFYFCKPIELVEVEQNFSPALLAVTPSSPFSA